MIAALVLASIVVSAAPSLRGTWVWDDRVWGPTAFNFHDTVFGVQGSIWRPASNIVNYLVHAALPTPLFHRLARLLLHLVAVTLLARSARALGARPEAAWLAAATFGLHPAASECFFWISSLTELVPSLLLLGSWAAFLSGRSVLAGVLAAISPFGKEAFLLAPGSLLLLGWGTSRKPWLSSGIALAGSLSYLGLRAALTGPLPVGALRSDPLGAIGASGARLLELFLVPGSADLFVPFQSARAAGVAVLVVVAVAAALAKRRPALAAAVAGLPPLLPNAIAVASTRLVADRYFYTALAGICLALALLLERLFQKRVRLAPALALIPLALGASTFLRAFDWVDTEHVALASLQRDPDNTRAAFHYAFALHTEGPGCGAAIPWYQRGLESDERAATNLLACLVSEKRFAEAVALAPRVPLSSAAGSRNIARAFASLGQAGPALEAARRATVLDPRSPASWVLLGQVQALAGALEAAQRSFSTALSLEPGSAEAQAGLAALRGKMERAGTLNERSPLPPP
ncbi:MAG TPA: tetratricopeptide repeat protein [Myxococcales bacterium]